MNEIFKRWRGELLPWPGAALEKVRAAAPAALGDAAAAILNAWAAGNLS